jgi:transcription-repair coupling factor (superfamily II helicase)
VLINTGELETAAERFWQDATQRYESRRVDPMRPLLEPENLWLRVETLFAELKAWPRVQLRTDSLPKKSCNTLISATKPCRISPCSHKTKAPMDNLRRFNESLCRQSGFSVESEGRRETLQDLLARIKIDARSLISRIEEAEAPDVTS